MRRTLCALFLAGISLFWAAAGIPAEEKGAKGEPPAEEVEISTEDRQVIRKMELLRLMEMLKDMELLEGETKAVSEDKK